MRRLGTVCILFLVALTPVGTHANVIEDIECAACRVGLDVTGVAAQGLLDASGEGEVESATIATEGAPLKIAAEAEGKSLSDLAKETPAFMTVLTGFAKVLQKVIPGITNAPTECILEVFLEHIDMMVLSGGQFILPILMDEAAQWTCCGKTCTPFKPKEEPKPPPPVPPAPQSTQVVVRLDDAMNAGKKAGIYGPRSSDLNDIDLWKEAQEAVTKLGEFCVTNNAPEVAENDEQKNEQNLARVDNNACSCQYFCWTWQFSSRPASWKSTCFDVISSGSWKGSEPSCPGAWWRHVSGPPDMTPPIYENTANWRYFNSVPNHPLNHLDLMASNSVLALDPLRSVSLANDGGYTSSRQFMLKNVQITLSFGARTGGYNIAGPELDAKIGMQRVAMLKRELSKKFDPRYEKHPTKDFVYLDSDALKELEGQYENTEKPGTFLNKWWKEYYQAAMDNSKLMIFLIDDAWLNSPNCWEELAWANDWQLDQDAKIKKPPKIVFQPRPQREYIPHNAPETKFIVAYLGDKFHNEPTRTTSDVEEGGEVLLQWTEKNGMENNGRCRLPGNDNAAAIEVICPELSRGTYVAGAAFTLKTGVEKILDKVTELVNSKKLTFA